ncbi:hypothetical protein [Haloechinothrix halophila]|uniref:hypothetical protein n=1 Tax=Haloechinothrix halophila TaxID=1069073 RepID=UPI000557D888|nr:hypothetical protein [Haloechinothrix halophila]
MTDQLAAVPASEPAPHGGPVTKTRVFFERHWQRRRPGRPTPDWVVSFIYRTWLLALLFKVVGSSWDMSWHFMWIRDDFAPPHLLNSVGTVMVCALVIIHTYTGMGCTRRSLRLMQAGTVTFLLAAPLDVLNHRISGLDLTAWSPTHAMLYIGTAVMILGAIDGWLSSSKPGRTRTLTLVALWAFLLETVYFANGQQEYGILALRAWERGEPGAEQSLLQFAADDLGRAVDREAVIHFALPIPDWVYPLWGIGVMALLLIAARAVVRVRWTATAVAGAYVAYRAAIWPLLVGAGFPPSTVPFYLVFVGLAVDLAFLLPAARSRAPIGAALVTALGFGALWTQAQLRPWLLGDVHTESAPPVDYWTLPVVLVGVGVLWLVLEPYATRLRADAPR